MKPIEIILIALLVGFGVFVYLKAFTVYCILETVVNFIVFPIDFLLGVYNPLNIMVFTKDGFMAGRRRRVVSPFGRTCKLGIMVVVFLISLIYVGKHLLGADGFHDSMGTVIGNLPIAVLSSSLSRGLFSLDFVSYAGLIATAFSSFLAMVYMRYTVDALSEMPRTNPLYWLMVVVFNVVFTFMSCLLCEQLAPWFGETANRFADFFQGLKETAKGLRITGIGSFFRFLGTWLSVILVSYLALATLAVFVREYLAAIMYGLFALAVMIVVGLIVQDWLELPGYATSIAFIVTLLVLEYIRIDPDTNDAFKAFLLDLSCF